MALADSNLPGADLVAAGVAACERGEVTIESLLVAIGAPRLRRLGIGLPGVARISQQPEHDLYRLLGESHPRDAHSQYNSLVRRLVSFERALERERTRSIRRG